MPTGRERDYNDIQRLNREVARLTAERDEAVLIAKAYLGELELTAELLGAECVATIRDEIRVLMERCGNLMEETKRP